LEIPVLTIMCGVPAVGKSTYAKNYLQEHPSAVHLTSDGIRKELYGSEAILGDRNKVFTMMVERSKMHLSDGRNVLYDSTALTRNARRKILSQCPSYVRTVCTILWAPREICIARDAARERTVGADVIDLLIGMFEAPFYDERLTDIHILLPEHFDSEAYAREMDLPLENQSIADPDVRFAERCIRGGISPWTAIGLPGATPFGIWLISTHQAKPDGSYREKLPDFLKKALSELN